MCPSFGQCFPEEIRDKFARESLRKGAVLRLHRKDTNPPKIKLLIVIGIVGSKDTNPQSVGCVYINTKNNPRANDLYLKSDGREYLDHDSYVGLINIFEDSFETFAGLIRQDPGCVKGELTVPDMENLSRAIQSSRTIAPKLKKRYGFQ